MYKRRKRYEGKAPIEDSQPSKSPVTIPGKKVELIPNEVGQEPERSGSSTRTNMVRNPNEVGRQAERR